MNRLHGKTSGIGPGAFATLVAVASASSASRAASDVGWPTVNGTLYGQRYSPLAYRFACDPHRASMRGTHEVT